jgi:hypothetical protein
MLTWMASIDYPRPPGRERAGSGPARRSIRAGAAGAPHALMAARVASDGARFGAVPGARLTDAKRFALYDWPGSEGID